jgi:uncharacterized membrane protein
MFQLLLFLHVIGAIAVFGPIFAFPLIVNQARKNPQFGHFAAIVTEMIERRIVLPGAVVQGITGVLLILNTGRDLTLPVNRWLVAGIILYLVTISLAAFVQAKNAEEMVRLLSAGPPPGPPPAGAPAGPPPEIAELAKKLQRTGMLLTGLITVIVLLMVTKPAF